MDGRPRQEEMMFILGDDQKVTLSIAPVDAAGNPAPVDGVPSWSLSDTKYIGLEVADDGMSATAIAIGLLGTTQVQVAADADLGEGVVTINGTLDIEVVAGQAVGLSIAAGTPEPK